MKPICNLFPYCSAAMLWSSCYYKDVFPSYWIWDFLWPVQLETRLLATTTTASGSSPWCTASTPVPSQGCYRHGAASSSGGAGRSAATPVGGGSFFFSSLCSVSHTDGKVKKATHGRSAGSFLVQIFCPLHVWCYAREAGTNFHLVFLFRFSALYLFDVMPVRLEKNSKFANLIGLKKFKIL